MSLMGVVHNSLGLTMLFLVLSALFLEVRSLQRSSALCRGITRLGTGKPMCTETLVTKAPWSGACWVCGPWVCGAPMPWLLSRACGDAVRRPLSAVQAIGVPC